MSLKPIKGGRRHRSHAPRLEGGNWGAKRKEEFTDFKKWARVGILASVIILGVLATSYAYYANIYLPSLPPTNPNYDPFTLLWNGTTSAVQQLSFVDFNALAQTTGTSGNVNCCLVNPGVASDQLLVVMYEQGLDCNPTVSDSKGSIYNMVYCNAQTTNNCGAMTIGLWATLKIAASGTNIVTVTFSSSKTFGINIEEYSGIRGFGTPVGDFSLTGATSSSITASFSGQGEFEGWMGNQAANCAAFPVVTENSGQTVRTSSGVNVLQLAMDNLALVSGNVAYSLSFSVSSEYNHFIIPVGLVGGTGACPIVGYQCLFATTDATGNVQLNAKPTGPSTLDSFHPSLSNAAQLNGGAGGQSFTITGNSWQIGSVQFMMNQTATWQGSISAQLFQNTGIPGSGATPTGKALATSTITITSSSLTAGPATTITFPFTAGPVLSPGNYWAVLNASNVPTTGGIPQAWRNGTFASHNRAFFNMTTGWNAVATSLWFTVTGSAASAVAITSSPIDVLTSASKELFFYETWRNSTNLATTAPWGWYLTVNSTLPTQANYSPLTDPSVVMANVVYPNAGDTSKNYYEYQAKTPGQSLLSASGAGTDPFPSCPQTSTLYLCSGSNTASGTQFLAISTTLNYTGNAGNVGANGFSLLCADGTPTQAPPTSNFCSSATQTPTLTPCTGSPAYCATTTLPFLNINGGPYYLGFWSSSGQNATILFGTSNSGAASARANSVWYWVPAPSCPPTCAVTDTGGFFGWLGKTLGGAYNAAAGVLGPIVSPILNAGNSLQNAVVSALVQAGNLLINGLVLLESLLQSVMNLIGNAVGLGNVGTDFFAILNSVVAFFTSGNFGSIFTNAPAIFNRLIDTLAIYFPWLPTGLTVASRFATLGINSIGFILTIIGFMFQFVSGAFATYLIAMWFVYTGDDSLAGVLGLIETTEYLIFGLGLKYLAYLVNFSLDVVTNLIGLIPKPLIQMVAHQFPRIPIVEVNARFVWPGGSMSEIRNGNILSAACWVSGILFLDMYETASPALPGSIGFLLPSAVSSLAPLAGFIPFLEIMTAFVWGAAFLMIPIHWLSNAFDFGELPFDSAIGTKISGGFGGISFRKAEKHQTNIRAAFKSLRQGLRREGPMGETNVKRYEKLGISKTMSGGNIN